MEKDKEQFLLNNQAYYGNSVYYVVLKDLCINFKHKKRW